STTRGGPGRKRSTATSVERAGRSELVRGAVAYAVGPAPAAPRPAGEAARAALATMARAGRRRRLLGWRARIRERGGVAAADELLRRPRLPPLRRRAEAGAGAHRPRSAPLPPPAP